MVETKIYTILTSDADVARRVQSRVYPLVMPQDVALPAISYQRLTGDKINDLNGYSGLENDHISVSAWAMTYSEAKALAGEVHVAMDISTLSNVLISDMDFYDPELNIYGVAMEFSCWEQN